MTPAQVAHIMALVDAYLYAPLKQRREAIEAALRDAPQQAEGWVLIATDAYEAGFGKGVQAQQRGIEIVNPWGDEPGREGWALGYEMGKQRTATPSAPTAEDSTVVEPVRDERAAFEAWRANAPWYITSSAFSEDNEETGCTLRLMNLAASEAWQARASKGTPPPAPVLLSDAECRTDGRCQYAIDHGAEDLGHCPKGKFAMPALNDAEERAAFEAWVNEQPEGVSKKWWCRQIDDGGYSCYEADLTWRAWKARAIGRASREARK